MGNSAGRLPWPPLLGGHLIKRYKRFLADVALAGGETVTAHCPNSGAMTTCCESGRPVYLSYHDNPRRKLKYTWELIEMSTSLVGVNTLVPNRLVCAAVSAGDITALNGYESLRREVAVKPGTRLDVLLEGTARRPCYVEIKNCSMVNAGRAAFPDAVTTRGRKHLDALCELVANGARGVIFYLVQRMDATSFAPADHVDPAYGARLREVVASGVEMLAYDVSIDLDHIAIRRPLPCRF